MIIKRFDITDAYHGSIRLDIPETARLICVNGFHLRFYLYIAIEPEYDPIDYEDDVDFRRRTNIRILKDGNVVPTDFDVTYYGSIFTDTQTSSPMFDRVAYHVFGQRLRSYQ